MIAVPSGNSGGSLRHRCTTNALSPSQANSTSPPPPGTPRRQRPTRASRRATAGSGGGGAIGASFVARGLPFAARSARGDSSPGVRGQARAAGRSPPSPASPRRRAAVSRVRPRPAPPIRAPRRPRPRAPRPGRPAAREPAPRPHLDRPARHARDARRPVERRLEIRHVDDVVAGERLLRLRERSVADDPLAAAHAHRRGGAGRLQRLAGDEYALVAEGAGVGIPPRVLGLLLLGRQAAGRVADDEHVLGHRGPPVSGPALPASIPATNGPGRIRHVRAPPPAPQAFTGRSRRSGPDRPAVSPPRARPLARGAPPSRARSGRGSPCAAARPWA